MFVAVELAESSTNVMNTKCGQLIINIKYDWDDVLLSDFVVCSGKEAFAYQVGMNWETLQR